MKAVRIHAFGGPEVMQIEDLPKPTPGPGEVLVEVKAASLNPVDYKTREGEFPPVKAAQLPIVLGRDVAGVATSFGEGASDLAVDEDVYAMLPTDVGGFAEWIVAPADLFARKPKSIDMTEAASVPLAALTAWQGLFDHGRLKAGQRVLIHGASGGVGLFAVQFAKAAGAEVLATCGGDQKALVESLGAARAIDYKAERFEDIAEDVDLVFDLVGGETQDRSWAVLQPGGALICTMQEPDQARAQAAGVRAQRYMAEPSRAQLTEIGGMIDEGRVRVIVDRIFPLAQVVDAENRLEHDHVVGKVVLSVGA